MGIPYCLTLHFWVICFPSTLFYLSDEVLSDALPPLFLLVVANALGTLGPSYRDTGCLMGSTHSTNGLSEKDYCVRGECFSGGRRGKTDTLSEVPGADPASWSCHAHVCPPWMVMPGLCTSGWRLSTDSTRKAHSGDPCSLN